VFPELADMVVHENALKHALVRLGGTRLVFSNAPRHYVEEVLSAIGLARYFDAVYSIEDTGYRGKPHALGYHRVLRKHNLDPHRCAMVDDILDNLRAAHVLGMSTVWVSPVGRRVPYVDLRVSSVTELPRRIRP
jgi:putative hydrolase of the HAD superfamily